MQGDDPPYLQVGTAVSAKYKGAFCEAKVSNVVRNLKCKVAFKMGLGTATLGDEQIEANLLRVGQLVQAKHPDKKEFIDAVITKIQDCSQYTVVFDDGDITTLRRTALCLKSGRHFNESETLDQLPLTHPEHFGNPVVGGRRGRRSRQLKEDSSEGEGEEENEPDLELYSGDIGKVVSVETSDKKRNKDNWFPGLIVMPSAQPTVRINVKDEFLIRSFKDGRYYTVPKKEVSEFNRELGSKVESTVLAEAVDKVLKYLDNEELPVHWDRSTLFNSQPQYSDSDENFTDSSDDEPREEKDHFVAQLYKFMDDSGTPLNKSPMICNKDVDLYRMFRVVHKLGGYNRVTNQNKWRTVTIRLRLTNNQNVNNQVKSVYKKCLFSYESFYRTLGCTMLNHTRNAKKNRGRPLIREKDRATPVQSPRPEKDEEEKKEDDDKLNKSLTNKKDNKIKDEEKKKKDKELAEASDTSSNGDVTDQSEVQETSKESTTKTKKGKKLKQSTSSEKTKTFDRSDEPKKDDNSDSDKAQQTRSKSQSKQKETRTSSPEVKTRENKTPLRDTNKTVKSVKKPDEEKKQRGRKRIIPEDKPSTSEIVQEPSTSTSSLISMGNPSVNIGDKLKVYYGPTHESKVTYEAKVIEIDRDGTGLIYLVHYTGWNTRYDEWINGSRIAENLSAATKAKRLKQGTSTAGKANTPKIASKRGRGMSITGRSTLPETPRSTTPSSVTSSSSRTKSPATPATRGSNRLTRQGEWGRRSRRVSVQTDVSMPSESESDASISEAESTKSKTGKGDDGESKVLKKRLTKSKIEKRKDDDDTEKEEETTTTTKKLKKLKRLTETTKLEDSDEDNSNPPKGRILDLNEIRSELKGFNKVKIANNESTSEKETISSDESTTTSDVKSITNIEEIETTTATTPTTTTTIDKKEKTLIDQKSSSSEDIYEFKEPEPFEFETRKIADDKNKKRLVPRVIDDIDKSPKKKLTKSPIKTEPKEPIDSDKRRFRRTPIKKLEETETKKEQQISPTTSNKLVVEDAFDKLVESPSFTHVPKTAIDKEKDNKPEVIKKVVKNLNESLNLFNDLPGYSEDVKLDITVSDEPTNEPYFSNKQQLFTDSNFSKDSPEHVVENDCIVFTTTKTEDDRKKDSDDDDHHIRASIQRAIAHSSLTDDDSNDGLLLDYNVKKDEIQNDDNLKENEEIKVLPKKIIPLLLGNDPDLLETAVKHEDTKNVKIADTILQKFQLIKTKVDVINEQQIVDKAEVKIEEKTPTLCDFKTKLEPNLEIDDRFKTDTECCSADKKRSPRKIISKEFIEYDTDSDSEERLVIHSDDDSQTDTFDDNNKQTIDEDCSTEKITIEAPATATLTKEDERNFKIEDIKKINTQLKEEPQNKTELDSTVAKDEETDSHIHSLLLCQETIPGSPAPAPSVIETKPKTKSVLEMPFASAPSSSNNNKSMLLNNEINKQIKIERNPTPPVHPIEMKRENRESSTVLDNTPPTTPESTISNLSPRGDNGGLSPNAADNDSCKSIENEVDCSNQRRNKITPYSEEDTLMNGELIATIKKVKEEVISPSPCKKRRKSCKGSEDLPIKRGRKPLNRSRHNSDSDDTSEHSIQGNTSIVSSTNIDTRFSRSPRPSKYNFFVELDPSLDSGQRIAVLQQKLQDLRKTYADIKAELAAIERRRKKIRRREKEASKAAKQEMACT